eukprot:1185686-Prorocentrum_minimum.AAC.3
MAVRSTPDECIKGDTLLSSHVRYTAFITHKRRTLVTLAICRLRYQPGFRFMYPFTLRFTKSCQRYLQSVTNLQLRVSFE